VALHDIEGGVSVDSWRFLIMTPGGDLRLSGKPGLV